MADAVVSFLIERLGDLLIEQAQVLHGVSDQFEEIQAELRTFQAILKRSTESKLVYQQNFKAWATEVRELAYDASDVLESYVLNHSSSERKVQQKGIKSILRRYLCMLNEPAVSKYNIGSKVMAFKSKILDLTTRLQLFGVRPSSHGVESLTFENSSALPLTRHYVYNVVDPEVVGLEDDIKVLVAHLASEEDKSYKVVCIHGMGGLGKTTLSRKIYNHSIIKRHFLCLAWVCISQKWRRTDILKAILLKLDPDLKVTPDEDQLLVKKIIDIQNTRTCLVVLDDVWSNDVWDCLKAAFPTANKSTKLLLTTRVKEVAKHVDSNAFLHQPQLLSEDQSWELLLKKTQIRNDGTASVNVEKMEVLGREMMRHCKGLPLGILVLGGILVTKRSLTEWERVHQTVMSSLRSGEGMGKEHQEEVGNILELSYHNLPYQLKLCFLHLGQFPEDAEIEAEMLYQVWMAEGFILQKDRKDGETMMDVAEMYLSELAHRSMLSVESEKEESLIRKFHSCRLHDLMRDLSLKKAEDEDFFEAHQIPQPSDELKLMESSPNHCSRRVVIHPGDETTVIQGVFLDKKQTSLLRSLILLWERQEGWMRQQNLQGHIIRFISTLNIFKSLRVLSLEKISFDAGGIETLLPIKNMTNLRYLSLRDSMFAILPIVNSQQLQTLDFRVSMVASIPAVEDMLQNSRGLQHLYLPDTKEKSNKINKLRLTEATNLETIQNFDPRWLVTEDLYSLTKLRKLRQIRVEEKVEDVEEIINYLSSTSSSNLSYSTLYIEGCDLSCGKGPALLEQLFLSGSTSVHSLYISGNLGKFPTFADHVNFLMRLTTLTFDHTNLEQDPMPTIERIPNLESLEIGFNVTLMVKEMVCTATGFPRLKSLELQGIDNFETWRLDEGGMPNLCYLEIVDCRKLAMLPDALRFLSALVELKITEMPKEFENRIRVVDGHQGVDFYKVRHVPSVTFARDFFFG